MPENFESLKVHIDRLEGLLVRLEDSLKKQVQESEELDTRVDRIEQHLAEERAKLEEQKKAMGYVKWFGGLIIAAILSYLVKIFTS